MGSLLCNQLKQSHPVSEPELTEDRASFLNAPLAPIGSQVITIPPPRELPDLRDRLEVSDGQAVRRNDGTLAGSTLTLDRAVRVMIELGGAHVEEALSMATQVPARLLGRDDLGRIAPGCVADLVLWDASMQVVATYVGGRLAFGK